MSESIWWPDEAWYERKSLPLGFVTLSFRQLGTILLSLGVAFLVSLPFNFPIEHVSFGGRAAIFCFVFGIGYFISSRQSRMTFCAHVGSAFALATKLSMGIPSPVRKTMSLLSYDSLVHLLRMASKKSFADSPWTKLLSFLALPVIGGPPPLRS